MTNIGDPLGELIECTVHLFHLLPISTFRASSWSLERQSLLRVPNINKRLA